MAALGRGVGADLGAADVGPVEAGEAPKVGGNRRWYARWLLHPHSVGKLLK